MSLKSHAIAKVRYGSHERWWSFNPICGPSLANVQIDED